MQFPAEVFFTDARKNQGPTSEDDATAITKQRPILASVPRFPDGYSTIMSLVTTFTCLNEKQFFKETGLFPFARIHAPGWADPSVEIAPQLVEKSTSKKGLRRELQRTVDA